jgi:ankyrin repeat protein
MPEILTIDEMFDFANELRNLPDNQSEGGAKSRLNEWLNQNGASKVDEVVTSDDASKKQELVFFNQRPNAKEGWSLIHMAAFLDYADLCDFLVKNGANIEAKTALFNSPLSIAAKNNATDSATFLLDNEAEIESLSKHLKHHKRLTHTPLIRACGTGVKCSNVIKILLDKGADPTQMTIRNRIWDEEVAPYHTTLHLIISNLRKSNKDDPQEAIGLINAILDKIDENQRCEFINKKTFWTELEGAPRCTALEFLNIKIARSKDNAETDFYRSICNALEVRGAHQSQEFLNKANIYELRQQIEVVKKAQHKGFCEQVADTFAFWVPFAVCHEILQLALSFNTISRFLENKYLDFHDRRITCLASCAVALLVFSVIYHCQNHDKEDQVESIEEISHKVQEIAK